MSKDNQLVLVVGYGNSLRRDDGAGLVLAEKLVEEWQADNLPAALVTNHQLEPELAEEIAYSGANIVLFVDAAIDDNALPAGVAVTPIQPQAKAVSLGHHLSPEVVMLYASSLYGYAGSAVLITVPSYEFDHGEGLSERCRLHVEYVIRHSMEFWHKTLDSALGC